VRGLAVATAAGLLLHTDESVTRTGRSVGWPDQNYFARRFKAHFGLSATIYRSRFADSTRRLQPRPDTRQPGRLRRTKARLVL
jgi:AraC family transcriptional regulator, L-rhamnose operon transcriptional activator RhaR